MAINRAYRIAHISDLHLTANDRDARSEPNILGPLRGMNHNFRQLLLNDHLQSCDQLLVTGDVTDKGDLRSWKIFWNAIRNTGYSRKTLVIPGNHDLCCLGIRAGLRKRQARNDLRRVVSGLILGKQSTTFPWAKQIDKRIVIIGVDSNNAGNYGVLDNAVGQIGFDQFLKLGALLRKYQDIPVKIVCLHHSPNLCKSETAKIRKMKAYSTLDKLTMQMDQKDRQFLRVLCSSFRVRLILHGHLHKYDHQIVNGVRIVGAPSSTEPIKKKSRDFQFLEYVVHKNGGRVSRNLKTVQLPRS